MPMTLLESIAPREVVPGYRARFIHSDRMTMAYWQIDAGAALEAHRHPHEQVVNMLEGTFELTVDGVPHRLVPGQVFVIPPNVPHAGKSITACRILDVFAPPRDDYR